MRTKYGDYPEYHTSLDNLTDVATPAGLDGGYKALHKALELIEQNNKFSVKILCEPQMGKRGLYPTLSSKEKHLDVRLMMNFISYCDGEHDLIDIAELLDVAVWELYPIISKLKAQGLIE